MIAALLILFTAQKMPLYFFGIESAGFGYDRLLGVSICHVYILLSIPRSFLMYFILTSFYSPANWLSHYFYFK